MQSSYKKSRPIEAATRLLPVLDPYHLIFLKRAPWLHSQDISISMLGWFNLYPALLCLIHSSPFLGEARGKAEGPSHRCSRSLSDNSWRNICHDRAMVIFCHSLVTWQPMEGRGESRVGESKWDRGTRTKDSFVVQRERKGKASPNAQKPCL